MFDPVCVSPTAFLCTGKVGRTSDVQRWTLVFRTPQLNVDAEDLLMGAGVARVVKKADCRPDARSVGCEYSTGDQLWRVVCVTVGIRNAEYGMHGDGKGCAAYVCVL